MQKISLPATEGPGVESRQKDMATMDSLERFKRFEIPGRVTLLEGNGELTKVEVATDWSEAEVYLHGAQVTHFCLKGQPPLLFTSQFSRFKPGEPIRGGIPICFPWFGTREGGPAHGFARLSEWELREAIAVPEGGASLRFGLLETPESAVWPPFSASYVVTVTDMLRLELIITNTAPDTDLTYEACLHTYFAVGDIAAVSVTGLQGATYLDATDNFTPKREAADAIPITSEVDRLYHDAPGPVEILDRKWGRRIRIAKSGAASTVVWNPGPARSQQMPDFGNEEYKQMLCVESGSVRNNRVTLAPGRSAVMQVQLSSAPL